MSQGQRKQRRRRHSEQTGRPLDRFAPLEFHWLDRLNERYRLAHVLEREPVASLPRATTMKLILPICVFALSSRAVAQQRLFACTEGLALFEIENYDTAPQVVLLPRPFNAWGSYLDIAVRPSTGTILAMEDSVMGQSGFECDPDSGTLLSYETCLYTTNSPQYVSSMDADHDGTFYGHRYVPNGSPTVALMSTEANSRGFTGFGPLVPANNNGDVAFDRDRSPTGQGTSNFTPALQIDFLF